LGIALLILYAVIFIIRQFIEPKLVANELGLPPILTLLGMYLGVHLFGFIGLFLVPVSIIFVKILTMKASLICGKICEVSPLHPVRHPPRIPLRTRRCQRTPRPKMRLKIPTKLQIKY
jgi:hypothetical protein